MNTYTAYRADDHSQFIAGLTLQEALDERWDSDGRLKSGPWYAMTDDNFEIYTSLREDQHLECVEMDGLVTITRVVG